MPPSIRACGAVPGSAFHIVASPDSAGLAPCSLMRHAFSRGLARVALDATFDDILSEGRRAELCLATNSAVAV